MLAMPRNLESPSIDSGRSTPQHEDHRWLEQQHNLFRATFMGKRFFSPIQNPKAILDLGCGTGLWSFEMADEYSQAQVVGMDLGVVRPPEDEPLNHHYVVADFEKKWPFDTQFSYIHARAVTALMRNHERVIKSAYEHLVPGGWFELKDVELGPDGVVEDNPPSPAFRALDGILAWSNYLNEGANKLGLDLAAPRKWEGWLEEAGFTNITHKLFTWPMGTWSEDEYLKRIGRSAQDTFLRGFEDYTTTIYTKGLGWKEADALVFLQKTKKEMLVTDRHFYLKVHVVYGQKPT